MYWIHQAANGGVTLFNLTSATYILDMKDSMILNMFSLLNQT